MGVILMDPVPVAKPQVSTPAIQTKTKTIREQCNYCTIELIKTNRFCSSHRCVVCHRYKQRKYCFCNECS